MLGAGSGFQGRWGGVHRHRPHKFSALPLARRLDATSYLLRDGYKVRIENRAHVVQISALVTSDPLIASALPLANSAAVACSAKVSRARALALECLNKSKL